MRGPRVYITGASGTGTTTLGRALAAEFAVPHVDTDAFYWRPSAIPFSEKRPVRERRSDMLDRLSFGGWAWSGAAEGWAGDIAGTADLVVFLTLGTSARLARLKRREGETYGPRIGSGGDMEAIHEGFLRWAARYDDPMFEGRSLAGQLDWLAGIEAPVLRLSGGLATPNQVARVRGQLPAQLSGRA